MENSEQKTSAESQPQPASVLGGSKPKGEQKAATSTPISEPKLQIGLSELQSLISAAVASAVKTSSQESAKMLAEALGELRKPYVDPRHEENEKNMRKSMREVNERIAKSIARSQANCPHLQGCNDLSAESGNRTSIIQHRSDVGEVIGICTNCQRVFRSSDPDYLKEMKRKSGNIMSQAGQRFFLNPAAVQAASQQ